jgi:hypothetical protein
MNATVVTIAVVGRVETGRGYDAHCSRSVGGHGLGSYVFHKGMPNMRGADYGTLSRARTET